MTSTLTQLISLVTSVFGKIIDFCFDTEYPGMFITIGGVLIGWFMIDLGFDYIDYFLPSLPSFPLSSFSVLSFSYFSLSGFVTLS